MSTLDMHWIRRALEWLMSGLARGVGLLPGFENEPHDLLRRSRVLLTAAVSLPALALWALLIRMLWRTDGRARWRAACQGTSLLVGPRAVWLGFPMVLFWCIFAMLPLLGVMIASLSPEAFTLGGLGRAMARAGALLLVIAGLAWGLVLPALDQGEIEEHFMTRQGHFAWPLTTVFFMTILGWLALWAWSDGIGAVIIERLFSVALGACSLGWLLAIGNQYSLARWQLALPFFGALLLAFATVSVFGYDFSNPMFLLACAVVLLIAGKLREHETRGEHRPQ